MLSQEIIKEFQGTLKDEYQKDITLEDASVILSDLMGYFDTLARVNHQMQNEQKIDIIATPD